MHRWPERTPKRSVARDRQLGREITFRGQYSLTVIDRPAASDDRAHEMVIVAHTKITMQRTQRRGIFGIAFVVDRRRDTDTNAAFYQFRDGAYHGREIIGSPRLVVLVGKVRVERNLQLDRQVRERFKPSQASFGEQRGVGERDGWQNRRHRRQGFRHRRGHERLAARHAKISKTEFFGLVGDLDHAIAAELAPVRSRRRFRKAVRAFEIAVIIRVHPYATRKRPVCYRIRDRAAHGNDQGRD